METFGVADMSVAIFDTIKLLQPYDIDVELRRVGPKDDGGYVYANSFSRQDVISFGVSNDVRFEMALARDGHRCFMYDHTVEGPPETHENFHFYRTGVSGADNETSELLSIRSHLARLELRENLLLKIDVEGAEWDVFSTIADEDLLRFEQIAGEFHWLLELGNEAFLTKVRASLETLTKHFTLCHVHANNCRSVGIVGGFPMVDVIELSFVRNDLVSRRPNTRLFPSADDYANNVVVSDHALLFFPFLPTPASQTDVEALISRLAQKRHIL